MGEFYEPSLNLEQAGSRHPDLASSLLGKKTGERPPPGPKLKSPSGNVRGKRLCILSRRVLAPSPGEGPFDLLLRSGSSQRASVRCPQEVPSRPGVWV